MTIKRLDDPITHFKAWFEDATKSEPGDPTAMALATADANGDSVAAHGAAEACLGGRDSSSTPTPAAARARIWRPIRMRRFVSTGSSLGRQVRVSGPVTRVSDEEADAYFGSRPRGSQIGAWASQASPGPSRAGSRWRPRSRKWRPSSAYRQGAPARFLDRFPRRALAGRILATSRLPTARPIGLSSGGNWLANGVLVSVTTNPERARG